MSYDKSNEFKFWNDSNIVQEFASMQVPEYLIEFFYKSKEVYNKVLDLGCGGGRNTEMMLNMGFDTYACDYHIKMVEYTKNRISSILPENELDKRVTQQNMLDLSFENESFDIVLANGVYHNVSSEELFEKAIMETSKIIKLGGMLYVNMFSDGYIDSDLSVKAEKYMYQTLDGLDLLLLPQDKVLEIFNKYGLELSEGLYSYNSKLAVGIRYVVRGAFVKKYNLVL